MGAYFQGGLFPWGAKNECNFLVARSYVRSDYVAVYSLGLEVLFLLFSLQCL